MTTPAQPTDPAAAPAEPVVDPAAQAPEATPAETPPTNDLDSQPQWVKDEIAKARREAKNLRDRLKEAEPLVQQAREAEEANKTEAQKAIERAESSEQRAQLRETELLQSRFGIGDEYLEFIGNGTYEEKEERAAKLGLLVQAVASKESEPTRPPTNRPVESLRSGASSTPPPAEDHSYPAAWGFKPPRDS